MLLYVNVIRERGLEPRGRRGFRGVHVYNAVQSYGQPRSTHTGRTHLCFAPQQFVALVCISVRVCVYVFVSRPCVFSVLAFMGGSARV